MNPAMPCEDCLILGICRHKTFSKLISECELLKTFDNSCIERDKNDYFKSILIIEEALNPTKWAYLNSKRRNPFIIKEIS